MTQTRRQWLRQLFEIGGAVAVTQALGRAPLPSEIPEPKPVKPNVTDLDGNKVDLPNYPAGCSGVIMVSGMFCDDGQYLFGQ